MDHCLTDSDLERLHAGDMDVAEQTAARAHLNACEACRQRDAALVAKHEAFLADSREAHADGSPEPPVTMPAPADAPASPPPWRRPSAQPVIEGYEITHELSRGGQGVVYQAVQKSTKRKVAIKVLLEGPYASKAAQKRFEREIELVAQLKHPHIISIFDSGSTSDGRQFCVMDYVRGVPLHHYVRDKKLSLEDTLTLFGTVCEGVQYAHQRGVIHRDLKPSNILVDVEGNPKIMDFGLAKLMSGPVETLVSISQQVVGTLPYMSPEQARGNPDEIDTRTDIYALGVILYEVLTGHYPYPVVGQMADVLRHIAETPPTPPSRQWTADSGVTHRSAKHHRLGACPIDDEVQTIVLRALTKERERRYQSAGELGKDLHHYLKNEPIEAKRDSALYMLRKQLRRYRVPLAVGAGFVVLVLAGGVISTTLYIRAEEQRQRAVLAEQTQSRLREQAEQARADAGLEKLNALRERDAAEREAYVANLSATGVALEHGELATVNRRLAACSQRLRGWEWRYLNAESDQSLFVLRGHEGLVGSAAFNPDGTRVVTASDDETARVWDAATGRQLAVLHGHTSAVLSAVYSPDASRIVTASNDKTACIWNALTSEQLAVLRGHERAVVSAVFSPDGMRVLTASEDKTAREWDAATGKELVRLRGHESVLRSAEFSPDNRRVLTAAQDRTARIWDAATGKELTVLRGHKDFIHSAAFSPDGTRVVTASSDKTARVCDAATGKQLAVLRHERALLSAAFSPDGTRVVTASADKSARIWESATGKQMAELTGHASALWSARFSLDGMRVVTASFDRTARIWDAATGRQLAELRGHEGTVLSAAFNPAGTRVVTTSDDYTARVWDASPRTQCVELRGHRDAVKCAAFSPDGTRVVTASDDETARVWDAAIGRQLAELRAHKGHTVASAFDSSGAHLFTASTDRTIRVWDAATGKQMAELHGGDIWNFAAFSPDGTRVVTAPASEAARVWDAHTGRELVVLRRPHEDRVESAAFSPDGARIITTDGSAAHIWDPKTGKQLAELRGYGYRVYSAAFSSDGTRVVTGSRPDDKIARIWSAKTGGQLVELCGHTRSVNQAAFSPDGTRVVTGSGDKTARIWDSATGRQLAELRGHTGGVNSVAFSPDGARVITASDDKTARIWDSVPYRDRYRDLSDLIAARPAAVRRVDDELMHGVDPDQVVHSILADTSLTMAQRQAALDAVLERSSQQANEAQERFIAIRNEWITKPRVMKAIQNDLKMPGRLRAEVNRLAEQWNPTAYDLGSAARGLAESVPASSEQMVLALEAAEQGLRMQPNGSPALMALGVTQFYARRYVESLATLERLEAVDPKAKSKNIVFLAYFAMTNYRLGRQVEAKQALTRIRELVHADNDYHQKLLHEAEQMIEGRPPSSAPATLPAASRATPSQPAAP